jgi:hypothetical protein
VETRYQNLSGNSGVCAFELRPRAIVVRFEDGAYLYDYTRPGKHHVDEMIRLAQDGRGLSTFISKFVRDNYAAKL